MTGGDRADEPFDPVPPSGDPPGQAADGKRTSDAEAREAPEKPTEPKEPKEPQEPKESTEPKQPEEPDGPADPPADREDSALEADERSLPNRTIKAFYGVTGATLSGPTALGAQSTVIGTFNAAPPPPDEGKKFLVTKLGGAVLRDTCQAYVSLPSDAGLSQRLRQRHVVYLSGQPGTGRHTSALVALVNRHSFECLAKVELAPDCRLADVVDHARLLRSGDGHLLVTNADTAPRATDLMALEVRAEQHQATVVVVGRAGRDDPELSRYLVTHAGPTPTEVFTAWLEHGLREYGKCLGGCDECRGGCVDAYVGSCRDTFAGRLEAVRNLAAVVDSARRFAEERPRGPAGERLLPDSGVELRTQAAMLLRPEQPAAGYRGRRTVLHQQAFRLAYAVLDGHPLTRVFQATGVLMDEIDDAVRRPKAGRWVLELDLDTLLGAEVRAEDPNASVGSPRMARLRHPRLVDALLDVAWNDYDTARGPLLAWLQALVADGQCWLPAAAVAGRLCAYDYEQVHEQLIRPWALSARIVTRQAAALACQSAAHNPGLTGRILDTVRNWVASSSANLHDSAARAYGTTSFAQTFPEYALVDLERVARDPMQSRLDSVPWAIAQIYGNATAAAVVARVARWAAAEAPHSRLIADRCLVTLARARMGSGRDRWPALLWHVREGRVAMADLAQLWPSALCQPVTSAEAWRELAAWITAGGSDHDVGRTVVDLLTTVLDEAPVRVRARFYLARVWRRRMPNNPLLDVLEAILES